MKIQIAIASSTHIDLHGDRMTMEALHDMAEQINARYKPVLINHDHQKQIGVILSAKVERMRDGEHALLVVTGIFESAQEEELFKIGTRNDVYSKYLSNLEGALANIEKQIDASTAPRPQRRMPTNTADLLEIRLDSTATWSDGNDYTVKYHLFDVADLEIHVYRDHNPPHFHVKSRQRNLDAQFHLETLEPLNATRDNVRIRDIRVIQKFFRDHPEKLKDLKTQHAKMQLA